MNKKIKTKNINSSITLKNNMMKKKILILMILGIFMFNFVSAESIGTFKLNEPMQITNFCEEGTCTFMNISNIKTPNSTLLILNSEMTQNFQDFNFSYTPIELGVYNFVTCGDPRGLIICNSDSFEATFSGKENNIWAFIISLIVPILLLLGTVWLNRKYDKQTRDALYKKLVIGFFEAKKSKNMQSRVDFATMMMYLLGYGILDMMFVLYYLDIMLLLFVFKDLVVSFGINTFTLLLPELIIASLWGLSLVGVFLMMKVANITMNIFEDLKNMMRGGID